MGPVTCATVEPDGVTNDVGRVSMLIVRLHRIIHPGVHLAAVQLCKARPGSDFSDRGRRTEESTKRATCVMLR